MRVADWIEAKKDGQLLPNEAIRSIVSGYMSGNIPDYQMSAFLMAVACRGMTLDETIDLTRAMVDSGNILDLSSIPRIKLDKHSSGGVGDKVTLALVPILAAAGVPIAKMSGHGLGHTGGTLDKLESIPGFRTNLSEAQIIDQVSRIGACICAQSDTLAPADRSMYALRDVTGSVASIPLIASSIMSKKIACGADSILLDIKVGTGAFMKDIHTAGELAKSCMAIGSAYGKKMSVFLTDMNQPLGQAVGNRIEIDEIILMLRGQRVDQRLYDLTMALCKEALSLAGKADDPDQIIRSGAALTKFMEIVSAQCGNYDALAALNINESGVVIKSAKTGYIQNIDALKIAHVASYLGAGREKKGDPIVYEAGVRLVKTSGGHVKVAEPLAMLYTQNLSLINGEVENLLRDAYTIGDELTAKEPIVLAKVTSDST